MKKYIVFLLIVMITLSNAVFVSADTVLDSMDTFDDLSLGTVSQADLTNYAKSLGGKFYPEGASMEITDDGFNGGNAFTITENDTKKFQIAILNDTEVFAPTENAPVYVSFKIKVKDNLDNTAIFQINYGFDSLCNIMASGSNYVFAPTNKSGNLICIPDEWYDVQIKLTTSRAEIKITDANGTSVTGYRANNAGFLYIYSSAGATAPSIAGQSIAFDEIRILQGEEISTEPKVYTPDGDLQPTENVSRIPEFDFCYEPLMKVSANDMIVTVADQDGFLVSSDDYKVTTEFETVNVKFTNMLKKGTQYTITLSGVKDMDGADASSYDFTFNTELVHKLTLAENGLNITSGDAAAIELIFDGTLGYPSTNVIVMSVIYDSGEMSYLDYRTGVIDADGKLVLSSYTLPDGKQLSDLTVLVFDESTKLIPICEAIKCFE